MRVLIVAPRLPYPPDHGAAQRNLSLLKWLGARHDVTLLAFGDPTDDSAKSAVGAGIHIVDVVPPPARSLLDRFRSLGFSQTPDLARRLWSTEMAARVRERLATDAPDVVQIEGLEMYSALPAPIGSGRGRPLLVLDEHNAEYRLQESAYAASLRQGSVVSAAYSWEQARRLRRYERAACGAVDGVVAVSPEDQAALRALGTVTPIAVVPNGVDTTYYLPGEGEPDSGSVLFIGKMDYRPNVDAAEWLCAEIWPRVLSEVPEARLAIVGRDPLPRVKRLSQTRGVAVVGAVADDRLWFQRSEVLAVPMRMGGGVRLKVLQAMATATPIVSTAIGMAGVGAIEDKHYLRGDTSEQFARQLVRALGDRPLRTSVTGAARCLARERFDWTVCLTQLDEFYRVLM